MNDPISTLAHNFKLKTQTLFLSTIIIYLCPFYHKPMDGNAIVITHGLLKTKTAKTAHGLIRDTSRYHIVGVIDAVSVGKDAGEELDGKKRNIPIYASLEDYIENAAEKAQYCLVGVAGKGGRIPEGMLEIIEKAILSGMHIVNGLHEFMSDIPPIKALADIQGVNIIDIRKPKPKDQLSFWSGRIKEVSSLKLAVLGTDCNLGKRTTARLLLHTLREAGIATEMIYTGQTGWMQGNRFGFIFDSTFNDFISGEIEDAILRCYEEARPDVILLEGQSSLRNPSGPGGAEFLVSGEARHVILQHAPGRKYFGGYEKEKLEIPSLESEIALIRMYGSEVIAITLNAENLSPEEAADYQEKYQKAYGIPVILPLEEGLEAIIPPIRKILPHHENKRN